MELPLAKGGSEESNVAFGKHFERRSASKVGKHGLTPSWRGGGRRRERLRQRRLRTAPLPSESFLSRIMTEREKERERRRNS